MFNQEIFQQTINSGAQLLAAQCQGNLKEVYFDLGKTPTVFLYFVDQVKILFFNLIIMLNGSEINAARKKNVFNKAERMVAQHTL